ncbi:glutamate N-acetyltransferase [Thermodesulfovibrio aggregans]|uniref:Arginine biosynthesis bifunctional protein ArgJ n=1 Tax=Thermodesulfovibrio aggregans TaxID=86166 RepID=A0A0U9HXZ9_9BACT|nr:bifunctional glutamate N-acetyltransferase/amino-acid acetyltransferase ArgJ [Thermodesulfovibrio aggregans]GAQ94757.1 glutamate N-acetyltransferase [Thermodesulfovibrio aggregans]
MDIVSPDGFLYSVAKAGIKYPDRYDIALIYSKRPAQVAGFFTTNQIKAAPVKICMKRIRSGQAQALILNSGNANACTGKKGIEDALKVTDYIAEKLAINKEYVYPLSTGVIGMPLPVERIMKAVDELVNSLGNAQPLQVAEAIMTTDTFPKLTYRQIETASPVTILGICKGAGMICPNMATMLCTILTDAKISSDLMKEALRDAVAQSFNSITVDGDMSTNDTVLMLANGESEIKIERKTNLWKQFREVLTDLCIELSKMIVKDGEGATKFVSVTVKGAKTTQDARRVARAVANSLLVKTALYGGDPNWGRVIAAVGYSGVPVKEEKIEIYINDICLFRGLPTMREDELKESLKQREIEILINLNLGKGHTTIFTTDLSEDYVRINSAYRT